MRTPPPLFKKHTHHPDSCSGAHVPSFSVILEDASYSVNCHVGHQRRRLTPTMSLQDSMPTLSQVSQEVCFC